MILDVKKPIDSLNKAFWKQGCNVDDIKSIKNNLKILFKRIKEDEREENQKNLIIEFLKDVYYKNLYEVNTLRNIDLVIHNGKSSSDSVAVIFEVKSTSNTNEMINAGNTNKKAIHEIILYYLEERIKAGNNQLKHIIITNIYDWYLFDANDFDKFIYHNNTIRKIYDTKINDKKDNQFFYEEIAKYLPNINEKIECTYINLNDYKHLANNNEHPEDEKLIDLFKILSPQHLLKKPFQNDSNTLNKEFYNELLHIIGLTETKDGSKKLITRKPLKERQEGSLLENTISIILSKNNQNNLKCNDGGGEIEEDRLFEMALELCITWLNRILFLKLLEGQLIKYNKDNKDNGFAFLNNTDIKNYGELNTFFFDVLAVPVDERKGSFSNKFSRIPYLNSSLFEPSDKEKETVTINELENLIEMPVYNSTVLKDIHGKKITGLKETLQYLFQFLDAFDFANDSSNLIQKHNKTIINASVLGLIFEKINGYKDGSFFTPGFITMYMCRETIRKAVAQKFKELENDGIECFDDVKNYCKDNFKKEDKEPFNRIIDSLKICDPAVGSGHFLVSSLNELIAIKSELNILVDSDGFSLDYEVIVENDELIISEKSTNKIYEYFLGEDGKPSKSLQKVQEALFHEKLKIIENCLFGVDINPKSVMICRLRLWIELLKNTYYRQIDSGNSKSLQLETLPNIDINIKCGNSLISKYALTDSLSIKDKRNMGKYKEVVKLYKNATDRTERIEYKRSIEQIKIEFRGYLNHKDIDERKLIELSEKLNDLNNQTSNLDSESDKERKLKQKTKLEQEIVKLSIIVNKKKENLEQMNPFEWRFEFPEVMNENGDFIGFDIVIGNPPYIQLQSLGFEADAFESAGFQTYNRTGDIYSLFYERGNDILTYRGILALITSNKWMRAEYGINTRRYLIERTNPLLIIDFGMLLIFENATVLSNIIMFQKSQNENNLKALRFPNYFDFSTDLSNYFEINYSFIKVYEKPWIIQTQKYQLIKSKVENQGIKLLNWNIKINYGIKTSLNEAFIINGKIKNDLIKKDSNSRGIIKPILRGQDIKAWQPEFADLWVIFIPKGMTIKMNLPEGNPYRIAEPMPRYGSMELNDAWGWFSEEFPAVSEYLLKFKDKAEIRQDQGDFWWEQRACSYIYEFSKSKIIYPNMTKFLPFVYDEKGYITNQKCFIITSTENDLKYLTAFFNSKLFKFCFKDNFPELLGETFELSKVFFEQIPIKQISPNHQKPFNELVDKILVAKQRNQDTTNFEKQIDSLVYKLYDLTEEDIKIIDPEFDLNREEYERYEIKLKGK
ncbi:MAG: class SAM-dependent methyltransferase [Ignavibacteria bacterium]|nr:class SAM-dependent methyltransferase [Ignavibacteria bacterium]